jgi:hypothetical protein
MTRETTRWWGALRHGGLLIAPSRLGLLRPSAPEPLTPRIADRLRADLTRLGTGSPDAQRNFLDTVFEYVCDIRGQDDARWLKGSDIPSSYSRRGATGEVLKPRRLWLGAHGATLPVFVDHEARLGVGRGRRAVSRALEWLRASELRIALLTNHAQFRLIYAGPDYDAWAEWDTSLWFEEGAPSAQVEALRWLIARETLIPSGPGKRCSLIEAIEDSRKGQAELSASLGERVRRAVEYLIQAYGEPLTQVAASVSTRDIYVAATRVVMRMVVILFAEARELLPRDNPRYEGSYGLQALREQLDRATGASRQRRQFHAGAWPRILGLFRLVHEGSHHPELLIRRYGGGLFAPGSAQASEPVDRALAVFEDPEHGPHDETVARMLGLLCRTEMRVRVGSGVRLVSTPVDFSDLSSEYIGILYEGLLDYELRLPAGDDPLVFLDIGDQPVLPLSGLEAMGDADIKSLVEKVKTGRRQTTGGDDAEEDDEGEENSDAEEDSPDEADQEPLEVGGDPDEVSATEAEPEVEDAVEITSDQAYLNEQRAHDWGVKAVKAGGLVAKPRSRKPDVLAEYEDKVARVARGLIARVVQPGEWFLVLWGGTRKGSGTFYTRPQLATPTVHRTLRPLAYDPPDAGDEAPLAEWTPKPPEVILALKVCDPAVGSGSFLVAALRFLSDALWRSVLHARWVTEDGNGFVVNATGSEPPPWFAECVRDLPVTAGDAEGHIRARLRRVVVERCVYGVDLDPLAIELARLSLWVETMNRDLPFEFLDHRLKLGNALVGCWFDRFRDYPAMAWMREGGDANHENFVHHFRTYVATRGRRRGEEIRAGDKWTTAIKEWRDNQVRPALVNWIVGQGSLLNEIDGRAPETLHDEAVDLLRRMEAIPLHEPEERADFYREVVRKHPAFQRLVEALDTWCALWFWPADELSRAPLPADFGHPSADARAIVRQLQQTHRFFHWELEFADVFAAKGTGFDAIIGNPPWETLQPNSREFFSNVDPLYRSYGKPQALSCQQQLFEGSPAVEADWLRYNSRFKEWANWYKNVSAPFGDSGEDESFSFGRGAETLRATWRAKRAVAAGYADGRHPFVHQGKGKPYTYKMFLEQAHALLKEGGRLGMITPSGVYTDKGSTALRELFIERCRWEWLFGFENRNQIFDIHRSFKFGPIIVVKGGQTESVRSAFMRHDLRDWEEADRHIVFYPRRQVERFSPSTKAILEVRDRRDLEVLEKIYANSVLLGDAGPEGWGITYSQGDFNMTSDSKLFPPRPNWEAQGYRADEYGRWIKFRESLRVEKQTNEAGWIRLADGSGIVHEDGIDDIALPLYQGIMMHAFNWSARRWFSGTGLSAKWHDTSFDVERALGPQFLLPQRTYRQSEKTSRGFKTVFRDIARSTDERTFIATVIPDMPCGNVLGVLQSRLEHGWVLAGVLNSFCLDWTARNRIGGTHLNLYVIEELPLVVPSALPIQFRELVLALACSGINFAPLWLSGAQKGVAWKKRWAATPSERLRVRVMCDALMALLYGVDFEELRWILRDVDAPEGSLSQAQFARSLDPKGFWRVDSDKPPELRHSVLTLIAFSELQRFARNAHDLTSAINEWLDQNDGEGWMLPETIRLADYGLGHDDRAKQPQPVRSRLGERFYPWQLKQSVEESWAECERHARNLLGSDGFARLSAELKQERSGAVSKAAPKVEVAASSSAQKRPLRGNPSLFNDGEDPV